MHMVWEKRVEKKWWRKYSRNNNNNRHHRHLCETYVERKKKNGRNEVERKRASDREEETEIEKRNRVGDRERKMFSVCTTFCVWWWRFQYTIESKKIVFNQMRSELKGICVDFFCVFCANKNISSNKHKTKQKNDKIKRIVAKVVN